MSKAIPISILAVLVGVPLVFYALNQKSSHNATSADSAVSAVAPSTTSDSLNTAPGTPAASTSTSDSSVAAPSAAGSPSASNDASSGAASNASDGAQILKRTAAKYGTVNSMRANFSMRVENPLFKSNITSSGTLYQKRPDKVALRFTNPAGDLIVGDGKYFWVYQPSSMAKDQVLRTPASTQGANVVDLQAQFVGDPVKRFNYTMQGTEQVGGRAADVMTLVPKDAAQYKSLKVWVDRDDALVRRFDITEQSGVIRHLELTSLQINGAIDPSVFKYTPPAGVRIVGQ